MTITLRQESQAGTTTKGSSLTYAELDNSFIDLLTTKILPIQIDADTGSVKVGEAQNNGVFTITGASGISTTVTEDSAGNANLSITGTTYMANLTDDASPQLSASLDVNGQSIVSVSNGDINITPNGSGKVVLDGLNYPTADGNAGEYLITDGSNNLSFQPLAIVGGTDITVSQPDSSGAFSIAFSGSAGISDVVSDSSPQLGGNLDVNGNDIVSVSNGNIDIQPNGTGKTNIKNMTYDENIHTITYGANITPEPTDGPIQQILLTGNVNFQGFATEIEGATITLVITQDGTGNRTFTEVLDSNGRMLFAGGTSTLSTGANAIDIMTITFIGGIYFASLSTNFS